MLQLNLPPFDINVKKTDGKFSVFDKLRRRFVTLTPEEWVRQHFINYLITEKGYSPSLIANEIQINLNNQKRRCDSVVYNRELSPIMIIEYKAPEVNVTQEVFDQIVRYNIVLKVKYLIVSNGLRHYCCKMDYETQSFEYLSDIPSYRDL
ncbi:MAG: type I restriction enzyme HsdR N-terminal domain-containing protein [Dysgonomonas sp.]